MKSTLTNNKVILEFDVGSYDKNIVDLFTMVEIANKSKATQNQINNLANKIKSGWWKKNKKRLLDEDNR